LHLLSIIINIIYFNPKYPINFAKLFIKLLIICIFILGNKIQYQK
jgi:hypothetical protein